MHPSRGAAVAPPPSPRRGAGPATATALVAVSVALVVVTVAWAHARTTTERAGTAFGAPAVGAPTVPGAAPDIGSDPAVPAPPPDPEWDAPAEAALAAAPMLALPDPAAFPQTLGTRSAGPPVPVPPPSGAGPAVAEGFPPTPEGAIGQLAALDTVGFANLDPLTYAQAYRSLSLPGAPDPASTADGEILGELHADLVTAAIDRTPLVARWQLAGAQIKGTTDGGRQLVACVLGDLQVLKVGSTSTGAGDCQSMRWTGAQWRIAPGPAPAKAPQTWPGTDDFARAGYRPTLGGPP